MKTITKAELNVLSVALGRGATAADCRHGVALRDQHGIGLWYDQRMRLDAVVAVSRAVAGTPGRLEKVGHLADLLCRDRDVRAWC